MSTYISNHRTNHFKVKDVKKFKKELEDWVSDDDLEVSEDDKGRISLCGYCSVPQKLDGNTDSGISDEEFCDFIQKHLDNDLAIIQEVGNEKLRYLAAYTWYVSPKKIKFIVKFIDGSFDGKIIKSLGFDPEKVTHPEY